jgi:hypothetical protein
MFQVLTELTAYQVTHNYRAPGLLRAIRLVSRAEIFQGNHTGNKTRIAVRKAVYRVQTNRALAGVYLVFHTYLI